jgi:hypothetical protein
MSYCRDGMHAFIHLDEKHAIPDRQLCACGQRRYRADTQTTEPRDLIVLEQALRDIRDMAANGEELPPRIVEQVRSLYALIVRPSPSMRTDTASEPGNMGPDVERRLDSHDQRTAPPA